MQTLLYADEVRAIDEVPLGDAQLKDAELKLAVQLVDQISSDEFHPEQYEDEVRKRYHEAIQRKVEGQEVTAAPPEQPRAQIIDLMEALKASLANKAAKTQEEAKPAEAKAEKAKAGRGRKSA
jgi:DNA end-binding protein Ku